MIRFENKRTTRQGTTRKEKSHTEAALLQSALVIVADSTVPLVVPHSAYRPYGSAPLPDEHLMSMSVSTNP